MEGEEECKAIEPPIPPPIPPLSIPFNDSVVDAAFDEEGVQGEAIDSLGTA